MEFYRMAASANERSVKSIGKGTRHTVCARACSPLTRTYRATRRRALERGALCALLGAFSIAGVVGCGSDDDNEFSGQLFQVEVENVSPALSNGAQVFFSPTVLAVHRESSPIFSAGQGASEGLKLFAEAGDSTDLTPELQSQEDVSLVNLLFTPIDSQDSAVLAPGKTYRGVIRANPGDRLSVATTFLQGNDLFIAGPEAGIPLFDANGAALSADVSASLSLYDAGTEVNEAPGEGPNQPPRQEKPDSGVDESTAVHLVSDGFSYPGASDMLHVRITPTTRDQ